MKPSYLRELLIGAIVFAVTYEIVPLPHGAGLPLQLVHHCAVLFTSLAIPVIWLMYRNRDLVAMLLQVVSDENTRRLAPVRDFVGVGLVDLRRRIGELYSSPGLALSSTDELRELSRACFRHARWTYHGVDAHVPSEWMKRYRVFFEEQKYAIDPNAPSSERVLAVSQEALRQDLKQHKELFLEFLNWHVGCGILVLQIDPQLAARFSEETEVHAVDVAFWVDHYAAIFRPSQAGQQSIRVQMLLNGDSRFRDARRYIRFVSGRAVSIELDATRRSLIFRERQRSEVDSLFEEK